MKILHITDSHGTVKSPEGRTDIYYLSFLKKMYELKYVIKQNDIKLILHTGDLFHSSRVSDRFAGQLAEIIKSYGVPMYVVPGNHDIDGYTIDTLDQTKLGLLYKTGVVKELDRNKSSIHITSKKENITINISGQEYYKDIDTGNMQDFEMQCTKSADFNILCIHGYLCNSPQHPNIRHTLCSNIVTDADVILSGHLHEAFEYKGSDFSVYNPGSMMRVEQTAFNKNHLPQYGILDITRDKNNNVVHSYTTHSFKIAEPSDKVFDYNATKQKKQSIITLENFKNSIKNASTNINHNIPATDAIKDIANKMSIDKLITDRAIDIYNDALNNSPDKLEVQQGYIPDVSRKTIKHVEIKNFQSHEYTLIEFKDGLNTIIGESNSGKTSILRAIRWCFDNDPKGTDFITTGRDDCSVTVAFSDGTSITRKRTRNDSGTYDVVGKTVQPDGTVSKWTQTYKGFANNLPIEIANIHQMPKINLTKDICTHLNMMSQLDGPFLVAESPQTKATIIGRLTGTQIIDLAIKDTNKNILNNSKTIKTYTQEKTDRENELFRYQYLPSYEQYIKGFEIIYNYCKSKADNVSNISGILDEFNTRNSHIIEANNNISKIQREVDTYKILLAIKEYMLNILNIIDMYNKFNNILNNVKSLRKQVKWLTAIVSFVPFVYDIGDKVSSYYNINEGYAKIRQLNQQIAENNALCNNLYMKINIINIANNIYEYLYKLLQGNNDIKTVYDKFIMRKQNIDQQNDVAVQWNIEINCINSQIENLVMQQKKLIKDNNICPCCGQKISDAHIQNINEFMKGE
jgi:exonuclease SbcC